MTAPDHSEDPHIWVVLDENGSPDYATTHSVIAHDHINDAIAEGIEEAGKWVVREYMRVLSLQEIGKTAGQGVDVQQYINSLLRTIEGQQQHIAQLQAQLREHECRDIATQQEASMAASKDYGW